MKKKWYPRVIKEISAIIENESGVHLNVIAIDASSEGVCIQCNTIQRNMITPGGSFVDNGKPVELYIWMELPFKDGMERQVSARCHVVFSRRESKNQCKIGMRYMEFEPGMKDTLIDYMQLAAVS